MIDLNCDLGEGCGDDAAILPHITSASVACGLHAGDPSTMRATIEQAARLGVAVGAHPGYPDRAGFGRHEQALPLADLEAIVAYQVGACAAIARRVGVSLQHVKAHGALYHTASARDDVAAMIAAVARDAGAEVLIGPRGSALARAAADAGLRFAAEAFPDRHYTPDGRLVPRSDPRAMFDGDDDATAARAVAMVRRGRVAAVTGEAVPITAQTLCLHGDDPRAATRARAIRAALESAGVVVAPLATWLPW